MIDTLFLYVLVDAKGWGAANHLAVRKNIIRGGMMMKKINYWQGSTAVTGGLEWSCGSRCV
ncbi:MAG: hypothetical protein ACLUIQ_07040 [Dialister invisus]